MRLDRLITLGVVAPFRRALSLPPASRGQSANTRRTLPVLMYHSVSEDPEPAFSPYYKVCTSPRRFAEHLQWLAELGYRGVTLSEGLAWLDGGKKPEKHLQEAAEETERNTFNQQSSEISCSNQSSVPSVISCKYPEKKPVAITFDDGFRDFHTAAFPALQRHGFSATMYLPTAFIGDERLKFKGRECLTWSEVKQLQDAGIEFGSHTVNHPQLVKLPWPEIERELRKSKATLDQRLNQPVRAFAYPFAFPQEDTPFTAKLAEILQGLGYASCATTIIGRAQTGDDPFSIKRLPANSCDDRLLLEAKANGAYDWLAAPQALSRRLKKSKPPAHIH